MVNPAERRRLIDSVKKVDFDSFLKLYQNDRPIFIFLSNLSENEKEIIELNYTMQYRIKRIERKDGMLCVWAWDKELEIKSQDDKIPDSEKPNLQYGKHYRQFPINIP